MTRGGANEFKTRQMSKQAAKEERAAALRKDVDFVEHLG